jgi:hypothetical protein
LPRELARFTSRVGGTVDLVTSFDGHMIHILEGLSQDAISERQNRGGAASRALSALRPFAAFSAFDRSGDEVKKLFQFVMGHTTERVEELLRMAQRLSDRLNEIQDIPDALKPYVDQEIGNPPAHDRLRALWALLARPDDKKYLPHRQHEVLLKDLVGLYTAASAVVADAISGLRRARAELEEFNRQYIDPALLLQEFPLDIIAATVRRSKEKLEASKARLDSNAARGTQTADIVMGGSTYAYGA